MENRWTGSRVIESYETENAYEKNVNWETAALWI